MGGIYREETLDKGMIHVLDEMQLVRVNGNFITLLITLCDLKVMNCLFLDFIIDIFGSH